MDIRVSFHSIDACPPAAITFVVIAARCNGRDVFCRHRQRTTWECPGGHIEPGESPLEAAERELYEETGCRASLLEPVCVYSVSKDGGAPTFGMLFRAVVPQLSAPPEDFEMACVQIFDSAPDQWTYPDIQPHLLRRAWPE
ncbi:MAG: NUDIX domain-containing protein [Clostridia bacterium]|nr:NUDIX domain-containing protein [Clostridia bacterium]